jgi:hypothetical protein
MVILNEETQKSVFTMHSFSEWLGFHGHPKNKFSYAGDDIDNYQCRLRCDDIDYYFIVFGPIL